MMEDLPCKFAKSKSNISKSNWENFDKNLLISDFANANWEEIIDVNKENVNFSLINYLHNIDLLIETCTIKNGSIKKN